MEDSTLRERRKSASTVGTDSVAATPSIDEIMDNPFDDYDHDEDYLPADTPGRLSRNPSFSNSGSYQEDWDTFPPLDKLTIFDLLDNIQLSQRFEKWQNAITLQREKVRKQREKLRSRGANAKERVVGEFRRRVPTADEQLEKYRGRMKEGVERLGKQWNKTATVTLREKISFIAGVLNIFISGYLMGSYPQFFYYWYSVQLAYFMPIRWYTYHAKGYHYFLADLCYFVNLLCMFSIWFFPGSKRLFISTYCLTFGNNAAAIAMWRNSLVFHSMDKVVRYVFSTSGQMEGRKVITLEADTPGLFRPQIAFLSTSCRRPHSTALFISLQLRCSRSGSPQSMRSSSVSLEIPSIILLAQ